MDKVTKIVRIKVGATVVQDHGIGKWPYTKAGDEVDQDMEFDAELDGSRKFWNCRADGYGRRRWKGETGGYGNGSILVFGEDGVEVLG